MCEALLKVPSSLEEKAPERDPGVTPPALLLGAMKLRVAAQKCLELQVTILIRAGKSSRKKSSQAQKGGGVSRKHKKTGKHWKFSEAGGVASVECCRERHAPASPPVLE